MTCRIKPYRLIFLLSCPFVINHVNAGGFQISEQTAAGLGRGFAGSGIAADDVADMFYNPAGMALLQGRRLQAGISALAITADFTDDGGSTATGSGGDGGTDSIIPNAFFTTEVNDAVRWGLGITTPFGLRTEYDRNWIGRYQAVESELATVDINPAVSYQVNDRLSIGAGINLQYADATLSRAAPPAATPGGDDAFVEIAGDSWSGGFNLGAVYQIDSDTRFGFSYRSRVSHELEGDLTLTGSDIGLDGSYSATADIDFPETVYLSGLHQFNEQWTLMATARWTRWSRFDTLLVQIDGLPDDVTPQQWEDTFTISVGGNYRLNEQWTLRAGVVIDNTPVPGATLRTPRIPDSDRQWLTFGASLLTGDRWTIDLAYAHIFADNPVIDNTDPLPSAIVSSNRLSGEYDAAVDIIGIQAQYEFD
ncbi:MAG TPA: TonB-dependent receptor [Gammaproteobacteria bacterium]